MPLGNSRRVRGQPVQARPRHAPAGISTPAPASLAREVRHNQAAFSVIAQGDRDRLLREMPDDAWRRWVVKRWPRDGCGPILAGHPRAAVDHGSRSDASCRIRSCAPRRLAMRRRATATSRPRVIPRRHEARETRRRYLAEKPALGRPGAVRARTPGRLGRCGRSEAGAGLSAGARSAKAGVEMPVTRLASFCLRESRPNFRKT